MRRYLIPVVDFLVWSFPVTAPLLAIGVALAIAWLIPKMLA